MIETQIGDIQVTVNNCDNMPDDEIKLYVAFVRKQIGQGAVLRSITLTYDPEAYPDEQMIVDWEVGPMHFERIRRITGYLVGTLDRFNNAKAAEEHDRVKHGLSN